MARKAMIIGLDSAVPELITKFANEGTLPNMKRLMDQGVYGEGFATHPTLTGSNWTSIVCGTWPGTQGTTCMYTHFQGEPLDRVHSSFLSTSSRTEPLWATAEKYGKKSILMKYPCTVPPQIRDGIQVEGSGAPWYGLDPFEIAPCACFSTQPYPGARRVELRKAAGYRSHLQQSRLDPLEAQIEVKSKSTESGRAYSILLTDSKGDGYDQAIVTRSRDTSDIVAMLGVGEWSDWIKEGFDAKIPLYMKHREGRLVTYEDTPARAFTGTFRLKLIELAPDATRFRLYQSQVFPTSGFTWPDSIGRELVDNVGPFQEHIGPNACFNNWIDDNTFLQELEYQAQWLGRATSHLMSHYSWDLYFLQWHGPNHAQHTFWGGIDPLSPWYKESNAAYYWQCFRRFYGAADKMIGDIVKQADDDTLVLVIADHGHVPLVYGAANTANALIKAGLLTYAKDADGTLRVDWSRTKALPINSVHIYVNLKGRDPDGIVNPGREYDDICNNVISALNEVRDPDGNCPYAFVMTKTEAEMIGLHGDRVGDIIYGLRAGYSSQLEPTSGLELFSVTKGAVSVTDDWAERAGPLPANTSIHGANIPSGRLGIGSIRVPLIACGSGVKRGYKMRGHFRLIDIAPTVSHIIRLPAPANCEGSVILEILSQ